MIGELKNEDFDEYLSVDGIQITCLLDYLQK